MAFSTQKDFLHVGFMNEHPEATCIPMEGVKLKTYASTPDERAWSMSKDKQAQYLIDLVACRMYPQKGGDAGDGSLNSKQKDMVDKQKDLWDTNGKPDQRAPPSKRSNVSQELTPDVGDDSVIQIALEEMTRLEKLLAEKNDLKSQLDISQEQLNILKEEKQMINALNNDNFYPEMSSNLEKKIDQLRTSSKIDKNDENELLKILDTLYKLEKAHKFLEAQNSYLRRLVEKLSLRGQLANVPVEPERSTDVKYLQSEVDGLRKEVIVLRSFEDSQLQSHIVSKEFQETAAHNCKDVENVAKITAERNALREKCQQFAAIEGKILQWKHDAEEFECFRREACYTLQKKDEEIQDCHEDIEELQYELKEWDKHLKMKDQEGESLCACLKEENRRLREEICRSNCDLKKITVLQNQVQNLTNELCEKNCMIERYDMQFQQLVAVIEDLQKKASIDIESLQDVDSQTHNDDIEVLAASTRATLDQISKELETQQTLENELTQIKAELETARRECQEKEAIINAELNAKELENRELKDTLQKTKMAVKQSFDHLGLEENTDKDCAAEVERLNDLIAEIKSKHENELMSLKTKSIELLKDLETEQKKRKDAEELYSEAEDLKKSLTVAHDEKRQLQSQNDKLNKSLIECENKVKAQEDKLAKLSFEAGDLASEMRLSKADLKEVGKLVKDINNVQSRNESLKSVLEAVDYSGVSQKEIADLKKQLEEERKKSSDLAERNKLLQSEYSEKSQKQIADLKHQLEQEREKSTHLGENNKLMQNALDKAKEKADKAQQGAADAAGVSSSPRAAVSETIVDQKQSASGQLDNTGSKRPAAQKPDKGGSVDQPGGKRPTTDLKANASRKQGATDQFDGNNTQGLAVRVATDQQSAPTINKKKGTADQSSSRSLRLTARRKAEKSARDDATTSIGHEPDSKHRSVSSPSGAKISADIKQGKSSEKKSSTKLAQLQKTHEAQRYNYEKEIEGHRLSNEILRNSITKLTSKMQTQSAVNFQQEFRSILDSFVQEICMWRCEKGCKKLTKLQEICKKILEIGIGCLTYKELVYLHQQMSEAASKLRPKSEIGLASRREMKCCKCSGDICYVSTIPKENEQILLEKLATLERDILSARDNLRKLKLAQDSSSTDTEQMEFERRANTSYQQNHGIRDSPVTSKSSRLHYAIQEEFELPTKDACGF